MSEKRKKSSSYPRHKYTTREIMDITEQRRVKHEPAPLKAVPLQVKLSQAEPEPLIVEEIPAEVPILENLPENLPEKPAEKLAEKPAQAVVQPPLQTEPYYPEPQEPPQPKKALSKAASRALLYSLALIVFLFDFAKMPLSWVMAASSKINAMVILGSSFLVGLFHDPYSIQGETISTSFYKFSLQGDLTAFYSLEVLIIFALFFAYFQEMTKTDRRVVFYSMLPLAAFANIFRVALAFGIAMNNNPAKADLYAHGLLTVSVYAIMFIGLIVLECLFSPE